MLSWQHKFAKTYTKSNMKVKVTVWMRDWRSFPEPHIGQS
jgi:hypothetical protein